MEIKGTKPEEAAIQSSADAEALKATGALPNDSKLAALGSGDLKKPNAAVPMIETGFTRMYKDLYETMAERAAQGSLGARYSQQAMNEATAGAIALQLEANPDLVLQYLEAMKAIGERLKEIIQEGQKNPAARADAPGKSFGADAQDRKAEGQKPREPGK